MHATPIEDTLSQENDHILLPPLGKDVMAKKDRIPTLYC